MNDEETVALIAGGHTFGKTHGAADAEEYVGPEPEGAPLEEQGLGWKNRFGSGKGRDAITSGLEVTWTSTPTRWGNGFFENLFGYEWELTESPAGAKQWVAKDSADHASPTRRPTSRRVGRRCSPRTSRCAWTRSTSRSPGASWSTRTSSPTPSRGPGSSCCTATWVRSRGTSAPGCRSRSCGRTPFPPVDHELIGDADIAALKATILDSGLSIPQLVSTAWASASSFRSTDFRGGANGARIRLEPQRNWAVNEPAELAPVLADARGDPAGVQPLPDRQEGLAGRPDRPGRLRGRRAGGAERRATRSPCRSRPGARTPRRSRRTSRRSRCSSRPPTASATTRGPARSCRWRSGGWTAPTCCPSPLRRRRSWSAVCGSWRPTPGRPGTASSPTGRGR